MRDTSIPSSEAEPTHEHLNYLLGYQDWPLGWTDRRASKDHIDLFGDTIEQGDSYFAFDQGFVDVDRLSAKSMKAVLRIMFRKPSPWLERIELAIRKSEQEMLDKFK